MATVTNKETGGVVLNLSAEEADALLYIMRTFPVLLYTEAEALISKKPRPVAFSKSAASIYRGLSQAQEAKKLLWGSVPAGARDFRPTSNVTPLGVPKHG